MRSRRRPRPRSRRARHAARRATRLDASCSNRPGVGTRNACGTRAARDDGAVVVGRDRLHRRRADVDADRDRLACRSPSRPARSSSTASWRRPFVVTALPPSARRVAPTVGDAATGLLDDRDHRRDVPDARAPARPSRRRSPRPRACGPRSRRSRAGPRPVRVSASNSGPQPKTSYESTSAWQSSASSSDGDLGHRGSARRSRRHRRPASPTIAGRASAPTPPRARARRRPRARAASPTAASRAGTTSCRRSGR